MLANLLNKLRDLYKITKANSLPLYRPGINYKIYLKRQANSKLLLLLQGLLYRIYYKELLVLKKTLKDHLNKGFIYANSLIASALVVFIRKLNNRI